jgi:hypothetical protein
MSVDLMVYLKREKLPTRESWQQAIDAERIDLKLEEADTTTHTGFWPCKLNGNDCGYEYFFERAEPVASDEPPSPEKRGWWARLLGRSGPSKPEEPDEADHVQEQIGDNDYSVTLTWHSSIEDCRAASFAAAILAQMTDGFLYDPQSGELTAGKHAVDLVKSQDRTERDIKMDQAVKKWASSTQRRCPECGAPCPEYRPTCFVCAYEIGRA